VAMPAPPTLAQLCTDALARNCSCLAELHGAELFDGQLATILQGARPRDLRRLARCNGLPLYDSLEHSTSERTVQASSGVVVLTGSDWVDSDLDDAVDDQKEAWTLVTARGAAQLSASMRLSLNLALEQRWKQLYFSRARVEGVPSSSPNAIAASATLGLPSGAVSWSAAYAQQERETRRQLRLACARLRHRRIEMEQERASKRIRVLPLHTVTSQRASLVELQSERLSETSSIALTSRHKLNETSTRTRLVARFRHCSPSFRKLSGT
jgi:hypothetical protein